MDSSSDITYSNTFENILNPKRGETLDKLINYYEYSKTQRDNYSKNEKINLFSLSDFNNQETADKKLIINDKTIFWVHEIVINLSSNLLIKNNTKDSLSVNPKNKESLIRTFTNKIDNEKLFDKMEVKDSVKKNLQDTINESTLKLESTNMECINTNKGTDLTICKNDPKFENGISKANANSTLNQSILTQKPEQKKGIDTINLTILDKQEDKLIFDVLLWMYTKDNKKLLKFSKNFEYFIHLLSLGNLLKMKDEYFYVLIHNSNFQFSTELFDNNLWSRSKFTYKELCSIIPKIMDHSSNYLRIYALLSWLKTIDLNNNNQILNDQKTIREVLKSKDLFNVRNYMKTYKLLSNLKREQIINLKKQFKNYLFALDNNFLFSSLTFNQSVLHCIICNKNYDSPYDIAKDNKCTGDKYHPRCIPMDHCKHKNCNHKIKKGEYPCCHKKLSDINSGCLQGDGNHLFILEKRELEIDISN